jgi:hypothetical protein
MATAEEKATLGLAPPCRFLAPPACAGACRRAPAMSAVKDAAHLGRRWCSGGRRHYRRRCPDAVHREWSLGGRAPTGGLPGEVSIALPSAG